VAAAAADDHRQFAFVIECRSDFERRCFQRREVRDLAGGGTQKDLRVILGGHQAGFLDMRPEIERQRPQGVRVGYGRQQRDI